MHIRHKTMPERTVTILIAGMGKGEGAAIARKIQEVIQKHNRTEEKKIAYLISF